MINTKRLSLYLDRRIHGLISSGKDPDNIIETLSDLRGKMYDKVYNNVVESHKDNFLLLIVLYEKRIDDFKFIKKIKSGDNRYKTLNLFKLFDFIKLRDKIICEDAS